MTCVIASNQSYLDLAKNNQLFSTPENFLISHYVYVYSFSSEQIIVVKYTLINHHAS